MSTVKCECGNTIEAGENECEWCQSASYFSDMRWVENDPCTVNVSRITGDVVCVKCSKNWCDCLVCASNQEAS